MENVHNHERHLTKLMVDGLKNIEGVTIYGPTDDQDRGSTVSFALNGLHPHDGLTWWASPPKGVCKPLPLGVL